MWSRRCTGRLAKRVRRLPLKKVAVLLVVCVLLVAPFFLNSFSVKAALSEETTGLQLTSFDNNQGKSVNVSDYCIYATNNAVMFYKDDMTLKTFTLTREYPFYWSRTDTNIIAYSETQVLVATDYARYSPSWYTRYHWMEYWIINVNSLAYSHVSFALANVGDLGGGETYVDMGGDLVLLTLNSNFYAVVGGKYDYGSDRGYYIVQLGPTSATKYFFASSDAKVYGSSLWVPHASNPSQAYIISRNSKTGTTHRIHKLDVDAKTLTLVATGSSGYYSDFVYFAGYLSHSIYGTVYYDVLIAYHHLTAAKTLYASLMRFSDSGLNEYRVTITPASTIDKLRAFSVLVPSGVTGEDDLNNGYYGVVHVGTSYALKYTTLLLEDIGTLTPSLSYSTEQTYQDKTHYYSSSSNVGGWHQTQWAVGIYVDYANSKMIAETFDANPLAYQTASYTATVNSDPEINADFYIGMDTYETPDEVEGLYGYYYFTAEYSLLYGETGYKFDYWLINGVDDYDDLTILLLITDNVLVEIFYEVAPVYEVNVVSDPAIGATYYVAEEAETYTTPETHYWVEGNYTFTAQNSKIIGGTGYTFSNYTIQYGSGEEEVLDCYSEGNASWTSALPYYQSFMTTTSWDIKNITLYLEKSGSPTGTLTVALYAHDGEYGVSSVPTGSALDTSAGVSLASVGDGSTLQNFTFTSPITLTPSTPYVFVLSCADYEANGGTFKIKDDWETPTYSGNAGEYPSTPSGYDVIFYLYSYQVDDEVVTDRTTEITIDHDTAIMIMYAEVPVYYFDVSASPEVAATFTVDAESSYTTPEEVAVTEGEHDFSITEAKTYQGTPYQFDYWAFNSTEYETHTVSDYSVTGNLTIIAYYEEQEYLFTFYGVYDETTGLLTDQNCTVTVYFAEAQPNYEFTFNVSHYYVPPYQVRYFHFELGAYDREYWVEPDEYISAIYVFNDTLTGYTINFLDFCGALQTSPYVTAQFYINGTLMTMDKRKVDAQGSITISLVNTRKYVIKLSGSGTTYTWGDLLMTDQLTIQLVLKAILFPKETLLTYRYLRVYAFRELNTPTGTITTYYEDTKAATTSVAIYINYKNGTNAFNITETAHSFSLAWSNAANDTDYQIVAEISHELYGDMTWKQYLPRGMSEAPWSLAFLGVSFPFESAYLLPALLIVFVAGCFSVLNAEVAAILTVITAIILTYMGWIPISTGSLVTAFAFAILMGLSYAKRRFTQ